MSLIFIAAVGLLSVVLWFTLLMLSQSHFIFSWIGLAVITGHVTYWIVKTSGSAFPRKNITNTEQKAVLITGCDTGFGHMLAIQLDKLGFKVFAGCLFPNEENAMQLRENASDRLEIVELDVTNEEQINSAFQYVKRKIKEMEDGRLWALVNNAGIAILHEIELCPVEVYKKVFDVNALGPLRITKAFLPLLRQQEGNRIVIMASLAGRYSFPGFSAYSMSKHAAVSFADALRIEMRKWKISVHTVEPTLYKTAIVNEHQIQGEMDKFWNEAPDEIKKSYGTAYMKDLKETISQGLKKAKPKDKVREVIDDLVDAVAGETPLSCYVPSFQTQLRVQILSSLPKEVLDNLLAKTTPTTPPADLEDSKTSKFIF